MKRLSFAIAAVALTACAGDRAVAPAAPAPSQAATFVRSGGGGRTPLVFLDGKEISTADMMTLDSRSIAKVEVIKGSKAIETYGERGANGVIFIDSKR